MVYHSTASLTARVQSESNVNDSLLLPTTRTIINNHLPYFCRPIFDNPILGNVTQWHMIDCLPIPCVWQQSAGQFLLVLFSAQFLAVLIWHCWHRKKYLDLNKKVGQDIYLSPIMAVEALHETEIWRLRPLTGTSTFKGLP